MPPGNQIPEDTNVIIEVPVGGKPIKYELDKASGALFIDRYLYTTWAIPAIMALSLIRWPTPVTCEYDGR